MTQQMLQLVQDRAEDGEFTDLDEILGDLGGRPQDLFWKEDENGALYGAADRTSPDTIARIALDGGSITAEEVDSAEVDWRRLSTLSEPESAIRDRQYD